MTRLTYKCLPLSIALALIAFAVSSQGYSMFTEGSFFFRYFAASAADAEIVQKNSYSTNMSPERSLTRGEQMPEQPLSGAVRFWPRSALGGAIIAVLVGLLLPAVQA